jgi:hypothetical protein
MKKPSDNLHNMAIEFVEFDKYDQPMPARFTPLGHYLHETDHSHEEREMTARLAALAAER